MLPSLMMSSLMISLTPSPSSSFSLPSSSPQHQQIRKKCHSNKLDNLSIIEVALSILDDGIDSGSDNDNEDYDRVNDSDSVCDDADIDDVIDDDDDDDDDDAEEVEEDDDYDDDDNDKKQKEIYRYDSVLQEEEEEEEIGQGENKQTS